MATPLSPLRPFNSALTMLTTHTELHSYRLKVKITLSLTLFHMLEKNCLHFRDNLQIQNLE